jgi:thiol-disulfide isomerase/thioredoxin
MRRRDLILAAAAPLAAQTKSLPFVFDGVSGQKLSTADHLGKPVALYFFNPSCGTCQHTCQILSAIQTEMGGAVQVLGATFTEDARETMRPFLMRYTLSFPVGYSTRGTILKWLAQAIDDGAQMPGLSLIDGKGVQRSHHGWRDPMFQPPGEKAKIEAAIRKLGPAPAGTKKGG